MTPSTSLLVTPIEMMQVLEGILLRNGFGADASTQLATVFTQNSVDGIYSHGINRFATFIEHKQNGYIMPDAVPKRVSQFNGVEQWDGQLGPGILNATMATTRCMELAASFGIGCVALSNTNHWLRGGTYGWQAAKKGFVFIGWTNTIANMPAWGALDAKLGNNPIVFAVPYKDEAIVLDMAVSQFSYGAMEMKLLQQEKLPVFGGFDATGALTQDPAVILQTRRTLPIGYWKGAGLSLLLDILAVILSGGKSTAEISKTTAEYGLSQVFIAIDLKKLHHYTTIQTLIENIISDYQQSVPFNDDATITYPGERVLQTRKRNREVGIPVQQKVWERIQQL
jgi:3-dehydro-L-gulonate 2-dehydrogenase